MLLSHCKIENIVFDAGGVLFGIQETRATILSRVLVSKGYSEFEVRNALEMADQFDARYFKANVIVTWNDEKRWLQEKFQFVSSHLNASNTLVDQLYHLSLDTFQYQLFDDTLQVLEHLSGDFKLFVVSNAMASLDWAFDLLGIRQYFSDIIISAYENMQKPDRDIYELAIKRFGIEPSRSLFIDDRIENVQMANDVGFEGVRLNRVEGETLWSVLSAELPMFLEPEA